MNIEHILYSPDASERSPYAIRPTQRRRMLEFLCLFAFLLFAYIVYQGAPLESTVAAILTTAFALLPAYLWCSGRSVGIPVFPLAAATYVTTHALPFVSSHPVVTQYPPSDHLSAGLLVSGFLLVATLLWFACTRGGGTPPASFLMLERHRSTPFFLTILCMGVLFQHVVNVGSLWVIPAGMLGIARAGVKGLALLAVFGLSHKLGQRSLAAKERWFFLVTFFLYLLLNAATLLLIESIALVIIAIAGFVVARHRIPWKTLLAAFLVFSILHLGKGSMRSEYRSYTLPTGNVIVDYTTWYAEWLSYGWQYFSEASSANTVTPEEYTPASLLERASVVHLLLIAQSQLEGDTPLLYGETYVLIPQMLIPRILLPSKPLSLEGTYTLNIHFGLQTRETVYQTTIGWGLLAEAYANFGWYGVIGLAVVIGLFVGGVTRWSTFTPILSARSLFAIVVLSLALNREATAGVSVASLAQSSFILIAFALVFMKRVSRVGYISRPTSHFQDNTPP